MKPFLTAALTGVTVLAGLVLTAAPASATHYIPCHAGGPTAADSALVAKLRPQLTGAMHTDLTDESASCARVIVQTTKANPAVAANRQRAAILAATTSIVESRIINHDVSTDHDSLGLYEQRASWGTVAQRTDPVYSTGLFLRALASKSDWLTGEMGHVCQEVQNSAIPGRYALEVSDATKIVAALWHDSGSPRDLNNDGRDDVVAVTPGNPSGVAVTAYHGTGTTTAPTLSWAGATSLPSLPFAQAHYTLGDMNHDELSDVVYAIANADGTTTFGYWPSTGTGFKPAVTLATSALNSSTAKLMSGDINADGYTDLIVATPTAADGIALTAFKGNGSTVSWSGTGGSPNAHYSTSLLTAADADNDGRTDVTVAMRNADGTTTFGAWESNGAGFNGTSIFVTTALNTTVGQLFTGDINADGIDDIVLVTPSKAGGTAITAFHGTGHGYAWSGTGGTDNMPYDKAKFGIGDANGDGQADIVFAAPGAKAATQFGAWLSNGNGFGGANFTATSGLDSTSALLP